MWTAGTTLWDFENGKSKLEERKWRRSPTQGSERRESASTRVEQWKSEKVKGSLVRHKVKSQSLEKYAIEPKATRRYIEEE